MKAQILDLIAKLTSQEEVIDIKYDPDILNIIEKRQSSSATTALRNFERIAEQQGNDRLLRDVTRTQRQLRALMTSKDEAEIEAKQVRVMTGHCYWTMWWSA